MQPPVALLFSLIVVANVAWLIQATLLMAYLEHNHLPTYRDLARWGLANTRLINFRVFPFIFSRLPAQLGDVHLSNRVRQMRAHLYVALALDLAFLAFGPPLLETFSPSHGAATAPRSLDSAAE